MEPLDHRATRRGTRLAAVALGLFVLLGIVAVSSRNGFGHRTQATAPSRDYFSYAFTIFLIVFVLAIPVAIWAQLMQVREDDSPRKSFQSRVIRGLLSIAFVIGVVVLFFSFKHRLGSALHLDPNILKGLPAKPGKPGHSSQSTYEPQFKWVVLWIALGSSVLAATVTALLYLRRRKNAPPVLEREPTVGEELARSISDAIDDLEAEPDARRAVIAAYARMEGVLARHGRTRRPSETPVEYLQRILFGLSDRTEAIARLSSLFEQAKFSAHEIDSSMKHDAIACLQEIRNGGFI